MSELEFNTIANIFTFAVSVALLLGGIKLRHHLFQEFEEKWRTLERKDKFRLAALDEKLKAHQEAFALARQMPNVMGSEGFDFNFYTKCNRFFDTRSLYLTHNARDAFAKAMAAVHLYPMNAKSLPRERGHKREKAMEVLADLSNDMLILPSILSSEVDLEVPGDRLVTSDGQPGQS